MFDLDYTRTKVLFKDGVGMYRNRACGNKQELFEEERAWLQDFKGDDFVLLKGSFAMSVLAVVLSVM